MGNATVAEELAGIDELGELSGLTASETGPEDMPHEEPEDMPHEEPGDMPHEEPEDMPHAKPGDMPH